MVGIFCLHFVNIALKEAFFARMKKVSPKIFQVRICKKHCTNFDPNSGNMRAGKAFYSKLKVKGRGLEIFLLSLPKPSLQFSLRHERMYWPLTRLVQKRYEKSSTQSYC